MDNSFDERMATKSDAELIKITTVNRHQYQEAAITSAQRELAKRNITAEVQEQLTITLAEEKQVLDTLDRTTVGLGARFLHFVIDTGAFILLFLGLVQALGWVIDINDSRYSLFIFMLLPVCYIAYYVVSEYRYQKTLGKLATHSKVVTFEGHPPTLGDIFTRTVCRLLPFDRLSYLFANNGFHDGLSNTRVVNDTE